MAIELVERRIAEVLVDRARESPVVALQGPRSVGKSTVLAAFARSNGAVVIDLDDLGTRELIAADPAVFVGGAGPVCIDEYQHVPEVLQAIKAELNRRSEPGRFVLTGSSRYDALPQAAQSLTGRLQLLEIMPFSQGEIDGIREDFLDSLFVDPEQLRGEGRSTTGRQEYAERACRGGLPLAVAVSGAARQRWYRSYVSTSLERDVRELSQIRRAAALPRLLERLAGQTGQVLNISRASAAADLDARTADNYVRLLEGLFLIRRLPAWGRTLRARAAAVPKLHLVDSGLAAHLLRITPERLARPDPAAAAEFGHLLETFVVGELLKQASWHDEVAGVGHWRTHDGQEVDLVLERYDGSIVAFEVKSSSRIRPGDISGLRVLRDTLGEQFHAGVVLGTMEHAVGLEDRIYAAPIDRLWRPRP